MQIWKVSWNAKKYDYKKRIQIFKEQGPHSILQSKGRANMVNIPKINDIVFVSCNKHKIAKCIVESNFISSNEEKEDECNIGKPREHTSNNTYLKMKLVEVFDKPEVLKGNQRTWSLL